MKQLPIGIQDFREIRDNNYLYIDKTESIHQLITSGKYYFLARPRRFGKSLLISTIKYLFQGKQELFNELWIADKWNWEERLPVLHFSFSSLGYEDVGLAYGLEAELDEQSKKYQITLTEKGITRKFKELLHKLAEKKGKVVILIDEYDKPIIDYLGEKVEQALANQTTLKTFYATVKDCDPYIRFLLITGVSKFSKVGVFSDLNNLEDLTTDRHFSTALGYTQKELEHYFEEEITRLYKENGFSRTDFLSKVKEWYNGYTWDGRNYVYNPFSILNYFKKGEFDNYWFETGTPTFLIELLKKHFYYDFNGVKVGKSAFNSYDIRHLEEIPLLFQTGYLTIKNKSSNRIYTLGYPNKEVKESMLEHLIGAFSHRGNSRAHPMVITLYEALIADDLEKVISIINTLFASIPNHLFLPKKEAYFHSVVYVVFQFLGQYIEAEVNTNIGRIDAVLQTDTHIYVLEFKLDKSAEAAIAQIKEKGYADKYLHRGKMVKLLGINFSSESKSVKGWLVENIS